MLLQRRKVKQQKNSLKTAASSASSRRKVARNSRSVPSVVQPGFNHSTLFLKMHLHKAQKFCLHFWPSANLSGVNSRNANPHTSTRMASTPNRACVSRNKWAYTFKHLDYRSQGIKLPLQSRQQLQFHNTGITPSPLSETTPQEIDFSSSMDSHCNMATHLLVNTHLDWQRQSKCKTECFLRRKMWYVQIWAKKAQGIFKCPKNTSKLGVF